MRQGSTSQQTDCVVDSLHIHFVCPLAEIGIIHSDVQTALNIIYKIASPATFLSPDTHRAFKMAGSTSYNAVPQPALLESSVRLPDK